MAFDVAMCELHVSEQFFIEYSRFNTTDKPTTVQQATLTIKLRLTSSTLIFLAKIPIIALAHASHNSWRLRTVPSFTLT